MILRVEIVSLLQVTLGRLLAEGVVSFALRPPPHLHRHHHTFSEVLSYIPGWEHSGLLYQYL